MRNVVVSQIAAASDPRPVAQAVRLATLAAGLQLGAFGCVPLDDLSGRPAFMFHVNFKGPTIGNFDVELVHEFFKAVATNAKMNLHVSVPYGDNNHHIAEAIFKAAAKALRQAASHDPRNPGVPSTKGTLSG